MSRPPTLRRPAAAPRQAMSWPSAAQRIQHIAQQYDWTAEERHALELGARAASLLGENIPRGMTAPAEGS